jgi:IS30 family transposase
MTKTYQQLTYEQRCQISALKKRGSSQREIAAIIDTSQSTVSRELARSLSDLGRIYCGSKKSVPFPDHFRRLKAPTAGE